MNIQTDLTLLLKKFNNGTELAYFSKFEPLDENEKTWTNNGAGVNEHSLICIAEDLVLLDLENPQEMTEEQMSMVSWFKWKDICDSINPTLVSGSNVNAKRNYKTINTFKFWDGHRNAKVFNDFFELTAYARKDNGVWNAVVTSPKGEKILPLEIKYTSLRIDLFWFLSELAKKIDYDFG